MSSPTNMIRKRPGVSMVLGLLVLSNKTVETVQAVEIRMSDPQRQKPPSLLDLMKKRERLDKISQLEAFLDTEPKPQSKPETQPQSKPETKPQSKPETQPQSKPETQPQSKPETETKSESNSIKVKIERPTTGNDDDRKISLSVDGTQELQVIEVKRLNEECVLYFGKETAKIPAKDYAIFLNYDEGKSAELLKVVKNVLQEAKKETQEPVVVNLNNYGTKSDDTTGTQNSGDYIKEFLQAVADLASPSKNQQSTPQDGSAQAGSPPGASATTPPESPKVDAPAASSPTPDASTTALVPGDGGAQVSASQPGGSVKPPASTVSPPEAAGVPAAENNTQTVTEPESDGPETLDKLRSRALLKVQQIENHHKTNKKGLKDFHNLSDHNTDKVILTTTSEGTSIQFVEFRFDYGGRKYLRYGRRYNITLMIPTKGTIEIFSQASENRIYDPKRRKHRFESVKTVEQFWSDVAPKEVKKTKTSSDSVPQEKTKLPQTNTNVPANPPGTVIVDNPAPNPDPSEKSPSALLILGIASIVTAAVVGVGALIHRIFWGKSKGNSSPKKNEGPPAGEATAATEKIKEETPATGFLAPDTKPSPTPANNNQTPNAKPVTGKPPIAAPASVANTNSNPQNAIATGNATPNAKKAKKDTITWIVVGSGVLIAAILIAIITLFFRAQRVAEKLVKEKLRNPASSDGDQSSKDPTSKQSESSDSTEKPTTQKPTTTPKPSQSKKESEVKKDSQAKDETPKPNGGATALTKNLTTTECQNTKDLTTADTKESLKDGNSSDFVSKYLQGELIGQLKSSETADFVTASFVSKYAQCNSTTAIFENIEGVSNEGVSQENMQENENIQEIIQENEYDNAAEDYHQEPALCSAQHQVDDGTNENGTTEQEPTA